MSVGIQQAFLGGGIKRWKHEMIHNKYHYFVILTICTVILEFLKSYPWVFEVFIALPPPSFIGPSLCMFLKSLLVSIINKTEWPQLYCACTNQGIWNHQQWWQYFYSWRTGLYLPLLNCTSETLSLVKLVSPVTVALHQFADILKVTFLWSHSLLNSIFSTFYFFFLKIPKQILLVYWYQKLKFYRKDQRDLKETLPAM